MVFELPDFLCLNKNIKVSSLQTTSRVTWFPLHNRPDMKKDIYDPS